MPELPPIKFPKDFKPRIDTDRHVSAVSPADALHLASVLRAAASAPTRQLEGAPVERLDFHRFALSIGLDQKGDRLKDDSYLKLKCSILQFCYARKINLSEVAWQGLGKTMTDRLFAAWIIGKNQESQGVMLSAALGPAQDNVAAVRSLLVGEVKGEADKRFADVFPWIRPDIAKSRTDDKSAAASAKGWARNKFFVMRKGQGADATLQAVAVRGVAESVRIDWAFADDIMTSEIAQSPTLLDGMCNAFINKWLEGRLLRDGWIKSSQNCWRAGIANQEKKTGDLAHRLRFDLRFLSVWFGVSRDNDALTIRLWNAPDDFPLLTRPGDFNAESVDAEMGAHHEFIMPLPIGMTKEKLDKMEREMGPAAFARVFKNKAMQSDDLMFPSFGQRCVEPMTAAQLMQVGERDFLPLLDRNDRMRFELGAGLDISGRNRKGNVFTGLARRPNMTTIPAIHFRCPTLEEMIVFIGKVWANGFEFRELRVESVGVQDQIVALIRAIARRAQSPFANRIGTFKTGQNKWSEDIGLPSLDPRFRHHEILWPGHEANRIDPASNGHRSLAPYAEDWAAFESEFATCPRFPEPNKTPDGPMSYIFADASLSSGTNLRREDVEILKTIDTRRSVGRW